MGWFKKFVREIKTEWERINSVEENKKVNNNVESKDVKPIEEKVEETSKEYMYSNLERRLESKRVIVTNWCNNNARFIESLEVIPNCNKYLEGKYLLVLKESVEDFKKQIRTIKDEIETIDELLHSITKLDNDKDYDEDSWDMLCDIDDMISDLKMSNVNHLINNEEIKKYEGLVYKRH